MIAKRSFLVGLLLAGMLSSCLGSKFLRSESYQAAERVSDVHLVVIGDYDTREAMDYLGQFLADSLVANKVKATKVYQCCRDEKTDMKALVTRLLPTSYRPGNILVVTVSRVVVGYGTTSSREVQLDLFNTSAQKRTWAGSAVVNMSWFVSDGNYRNVARSLTKTIMAELRKKKIV